VEKFNMKKAGQLMTGFFSVAGAEQISNFIDHYYLLVNLHDSLKEFGFI
jgi:hypothetical protein